MNYRELKEALEYGSKVANGGNLLFVEGHSLSKWEEVKTAPFYKEMLQEIVQEGDRLLEEPIRTLPYSLYKIFDEVGSRKEFEREYFAHRLRLNVFAILSKVFGEQRYIEALEDIIWAICDEYTWCLPAHLGGTSTSIIENLQESGPSSGEIRGEIREHRYRVDLFAAETAFALSEITNMLEGDLADIVVYRARQEVKDRVLEPYCGLNSAFHWEFVTMNWASVCAAGVGAAAMYLIKDDNVLTPIIQRLLGAMESFLSGYHDDGACTEGISYWNYGFGFFVYFAELLKQRTAGRIDLMQSEKVKQISLFQQKSYLSEDYVVSFSDAGLTARFFPGLTHYLKNLYPQIELPEMEYRSPLHEDHCYRWAHMIRNFIWSNNSYEGSKWGTAVHYLQDSSMLISRKVVEGRTVCFAAKGGHNDEPHNQNDIGSFILHIDGETLLTDPGAGEYTKQYFGPQRYSFICNGSQGHSVPIVEGYYQEEGREYKAEVIDFQSDGDKDVFILNIAGAYNNSNLQSLVRKFTFDKTGSGKLLLEDCYTFDHSPDGIIERFVSFQPPVLLENGRVRIKGRNAVDLVFDSRNVECSIQKEEFKNHHAELVELYLINLALKPTGRTENVWVSFEW